MSRWSKALDEQVVVHMKAPHIDALDCLNTAIWHQDEVAVLRAAAAIRYCRRSLGVKAEKARPPYNDGACFADPVRLLWGALGDLAEAGFWEGRGKPEDWGINKTMAQFQAERLGAAEAALRFWWERRPRYA
jgi:hypothetical protein